MIHCEFCNCVVKSQISTGKLVGVISKQELHLVQHNLSSFFDSDSGESLENFIFTGERLF